MVLAGPGSGKTSVIVERTAYMIKEGKIPASSILVVTFSRAAAIEMKERFLKFVDQERSDVTFGTFHGIFYGILKAAYNLSAANILSEEEKYSILREMTEQYGQEMSQEGDFLEEISKEISIVKGNCISLEHYYASCCSDEVFREIFTGYKNALRARRKLDFDDMILSCYELFDKRPDILNGWRKKFVHILVDEFQDINSLQYKILRMLAAPADNLFIVGDDDQSIYHFRGARPEIMLNFTRDYPKAQTVLLDVNYRCSASILRTAMKVIGCNSRRFKKALTTPNEEGMPVTCKAFENPRVGIYLRSSSIEKKTGKRRKSGKHSHPSPDKPGGRGTCQCADGVSGAFYHEGTASQSLPALDLQKSAGISAYGSRRQKQEKNFLETMNRPNRYISRDALPDKQISFDRLREYYKDKDWMCDRITTLETHLRILGTLSPFAAINFIRKGMGYEEYLREYAQYS